MWVGGWEGGRPYSVAFSREASNVAKYFVIYVWFFLSLVSRKIYDNLEKLYYAFTMQRFQLNFNSKTFLDMSSCNLCF
jgi:hypothetical protein